MEQAELQVLAVHLEHQANLDPLVHRENLDLAELLENRDLVELQVSTDQLVQVVLLD